MGFPRKRELISVSNLKKTSHLLLRIAGDMRLIGLTGGIATGKTSVRKLFQEQFKVAVIDADVIARQVVEPGTPGYRRIVKQFGDGILLPAQGQSAPQIDRAKLGALVFHDEEKRRQLNAITHAQIRKQMLKEILYYFITGEPAVLLDIPLLYETKLDRFCSKVVVVYVPPELQLERLRGRNPELFDTDEGEKRIASQMSIEEKKSRTPIIIDNSGSLADTQLQVREIYQKEFPHSRIFTLRNSLLFGFLMLSSFLWYTFQK